MSLHPLFAGILSAHTGAGYADDGEPCPVCAGSGEGSGQPYMYDCTAPGCNAATERAAFEEKVSALKRMAPRDLIWYAYQMGSLKTEK